MYMASRPALTITRLSSRMRTAQIKYSKLPALHKKMFMGSMRKLVHRAPAIVQTKAVHFNILFSILRL